MILALNAEEYRINAESKESELKATYVNLEKGEMDLTTWLKR